MALKTTKGRPPAMDEKDAAALKLHGLQGLHERGKTSAPVKPLRPSKRGKGRSKDEGEPWRWASRHPIGSWSARKRRRPACSVRDVREPEESE
jgi:hypothetical protein